MIDYSFSVLGVPVAQGSMSAFVVGNRAVVTDQKRKTLKPWRELVRSAAATAHGLADTLDEPLDVDLIFWLPKPKSVTRDVPSVKPDLDKLTRAVFDALTDSLAIKDDARFVRVVAEKRYHPHPESGRLDVRIRSHNPMKESN